MKSNDKIPRDEMLLAEALAAATARGLKWNRDVLFLDKGGYSLAAHQSDKAASCCAYGALIVAGRVPAHYAERPESVCRIGVGNDREYDWPSCQDDCGESLGWAFRCAMEES